MDWRVRVYVDFLVSTDSKADTYRLVHRKFPDILDYFLNNSLNPKEQLIDINDRGDYTYFFKIKARPKKSIDPGVRCWVMEGQNE